MYRVTEQLLKKEKSLPFSRVSCAIFVESTILSALAYSMTVCYLMQTSIKNTFFAHLNGPK